MLFRSLYEKLFYYINISIVVFVGIKKPPISEEELAKINTKLARKVISLYGIPHKSAITEDDILKRKKELNKFFG